MPNPLILVIDDNLTTRKMVECHLTQAGYRVVLAADADKGLALAQSQKPDLIVLDHQLPGITGDQVCRQLLEIEAVADIPVVISSAMRNRAFAQYTDFPNVVDQIPKPFTPELLKGGVANALKMGAAVVRAQRTGCAMPEAETETPNASLQGSTQTFPFRSILDFLNNSQASGQISLEVGKDRLKFGVSGGRIQAVYSSTITPDRITPFLPRELSDLAPLLTVTLGEQSNESMASMVKLLERSLSDPRRLRSLLRFQASVLAHWALTGETGAFGFEPGGTLPPMFQAFPLQTSLPALAVEGTRHCERLTDEDRWANLVFIRHSPRGGNLDRTGMSPTDMKIHALLDGSQTLGVISQSVGHDVIDVAYVARGLELSGLVERRTARAAASILILDDDPETGRVAQGALGPEGLGCQVKVVRDRVAAQLMLRRTKFDLVLIPLDHPEQEQFYRVCRDQASATTRFVGLLEIHDEGELVRLETMGLDGTLHRPLNEADLVATVKHLLGSEQLVAAS